MADTATDGSDDGMLTDDNLMAYGTPPTRSSKLMLRQRSAGAVPEGVSLVAAPLPSASQPWLFLTGEQTAASGAAMLTASLLALNTHAARDLCPPASMCASCQHSAVKDMSKGDWHDRSFIRIRECGLTWVRYRHYGVARSRSGGTCRQLLASQAVAAPTQPTALQPRYRSALKK